MSSEDADPSAQSDEGTRKLNHQISTCPRTFRRLRGVTRFECLVHCVSKIYSGEFLSRMSQFKNDIESTAAQARILATDEESMWPSTARVTVLGDMSCLKVYDAVPRFTELVRIQINILLDTIFKQEHDLLRFEFGMILRQGEWFRDNEKQDHTEDERFGKLVVSDFQCFRDVLTFVWTKQTVASQKNSSSRSSTEIFLRNTLTDSSSRTSRKRL